MKTLWRHLSSSSSEDVLIKTNMFALALRLQKTSSRRLQDVLVKIFVLAICLQDVFKTFSRRLQDVFKTSSKRLVKMSSRHLQDVFNQGVLMTSSRRLQDIFKTSCQDVFKMSSKRLEDFFKNVFKTSSRHLQDVLQRYLQDVCKTYHQVKLFLLTSLWEAFNTFLRRSFPKTVIYRGICLSNTTSDKFMVSVPILQER